MDKIFLTYISILVFPFHGKCQNLVPNPSFENVQCSATISTNTINYCHNWFETNNTASVDVFHGCFEVEEFRPPTVGAGGAYGYPHSGEGMAAFVPLSRFGVNWREIMSIELIDTLIKDSAYWISFYVLNAYNYEVPYAIDNVGIRFTNDTITIDDVGKNPHFRNAENNLIEDHSWHLIEGYYIAKGGEQFLNLGCFGNNTSWACNGPQYAQNGLPINIYYFIDDVSLIKVNKDSLQEVKLDIPNVFTPNDDGVNDDFIITFQNIELMNVAIVNRFGEIIYNYDGLKENWDGYLKNGKKCNPGVYYFKIDATDKFGKNITLNQSVTLIW